MGLESQSTINPCYKSRPIKADQLSIAWIKFITPSSFFGPSLECPALESAQISWISSLSASLIFLDLALVIGPTETCNGSLNACWFSSIPLYQWRVNGVLEVVGPLPRFWGCSRGQLGLGLPCLPLLFLRHAQL